MEGLKSRALHHLSHTHKVLASPPYTISTTTSSNAAPASPPSNSSTLPSPLVASSSTPLIFLLASSSYTPNSATSIALAPFSTPSSPPPWPHPGTQFLPLGPWAGCENWVWVGSLCGGGFGGHVCEMWGDWDAHEVFDRMLIRDVVCWTAMITLYEQAERPLKALMLFRKMQEEGFLGDEITAISVASAVGQLGDGRMAISVHGYAVLNGFIGDVSVGNSIVGMYAKCGNVERARLVFDRMEERNGITWNSMLSGYTQNGRPTDALSLFNQMQASECDPNPVTALIMVSACSYLGSKHLGRKLHNFVISSKMDIDTTLRNAIMDMYMKCGDLDTAVEMFNNCEPGERDVSSWNVLISGYGVHGHGKEALELFSRMQVEGVEPNDITFTSILSACSHAGLIDEGRKCFADMTKLSVRPEMKHYACMVDMLGRAGFLNEAFRLIKKIPSRPSDEVWGALLLACRIHGNTELGEIAANNLFQLEPEHTGYYVLMGLKKPAAFSVIEFGTEVHGFHTADQSSPYYREVYRKVESLAIEMKMVGYVPDLSCVLHDVEPEDKEHLLNYHSEKLAVAFGIMKMDQGMPIQVTKNLRVCSDCHWAFKFISSIYGRKIIVRDGNRFHHFQGGRCSCGTIGKPPNAQDFWIRDLQEISLSLLGGYLYT
ncbi:Pentatricopeptide repeat-containing protein [Vitis vinifera]|uniref:Pentatricopeptide repeat-containing protein n=1 Tax=Vitis vinifera TaxID=29760 RepID=A0A438GUU3_VITVI|nr:Pentatricopeptide repeat-containing protein [Vitis vinifera]